MPRATLATRCATLVRTCLLAVLTAGLVSAGDVTAQEVLQPDLASVVTESGWTLTNRSATAQSEDDRMVVTFDGRPGDGAAWLEDVDFDTLRLVVRRAIVVDQVTGPKSGKARFVNIPPGIASMLLDLLGQRRRECLARGWSEVPEWIFCAQTAGPLEARNFERSWFREIGRAHV